MRKKVEIIDWIKEGKNCKTKNNITKTNYQ